MDLARRPLKGLFAKGLGALLLLLLLAAARADATGSINLAWDAVTTPPATGYKIYFGPSPGNYPSHVDVGNVTSYTVSGLTEGATYHFAATAYDASLSESGFSNDVAATVPFNAPDPTPPTAPSSLTATASGIATINLGWTASTDNVGVTGYLLERCQGAGCSSFAQIATPSGTSYSDTGLTASTSYSYRVRATDAAANLSGYSNTASATTPAATGLGAAYAFSEGAGTTTADASGNGLTGTLVGPSWVAGKNGTALSFNGSTTYVDLGTSATLGFTGSMTVSAWVYETANVGDDGQIVAKSDGVSGWQLKSTPDTGVRTFGIAITNSGGAAIQRYSSTVRALNTWYHVAGVYDATAQTLSIYVNGVLSNGVLSGVVPTSQLASTVAANIGRRTGGFNIQGIVDDVRIYGRALSAAEIQADMGTPVGGAVDTTPPSTPSSLAATATGSATINLGWIASTDNVGVASYRIERCQGAGCTSFAQIATVGGAATSYGDTGLAAGTTYIYRVRAVDAAGNLSAYSNTATATTTSPPVAQFTGSPTSGAAPLTVNFTSTSTGTITSYAWTFGDGLTSTLQAPSHAYAAAGTYSVSLTVSGPGGTNTQTRTNYIIASLPQAQRTFVASDGNDSNACTASAPCRTLAQALLRTLSGGEAIVLDSADYGAFTVNKAVSIVAAPGIHAAVSAPSGASAITIAAGPTDVVVLRGLAVNSTGGDDGIVFASGAALHVDRVVVRGFALAGHANIAASPSTPAKLFVTDSRMQSGATGLAIASGAPLHVVVDNTRFESNGTAIAAAFAGELVIRNSIVVGNAADGVDIASAAGQPLSATIDGSLIGGNGGAGVSVGGANAVTATVRNSTLASNGGIAVAVAGAAAIARLDGSRIVANAIGLATTSGGSIVSRGNNTIEGNGTDGAPTSSYAGK